MSRGYEFENRDGERDQQQEQQRPPDRPPSSTGRGGGNPDTSCRRQRAGTRQDPERLPDTRNGSRREVRVRGKSYDLSQRERETLREIGRFRTIDTEALLKHRYAGMAGAMRNEIARLQQAGLLQRRSISVGKNRDTLVIVALTKEGAGVVRQDEQLPKNQAVYAGFVKPAEVPHDAAIYQMYQSEAAQIEARAGRVKRVILDYEFKKKVYSRLARGRAAGALEHARRQQEVANEQGLPIADGKIALPDLRIEYETPNGDLDRIDLELATEHYHRGHMDAKARAGFKMYGFVSTSRGRRAQWEGRELSTTVLSL